jgi:hypothetical protein
VNSGAAFFMSEMRTEINNLKSRLESVEASISSSPKQDKKRICSSEADGWLDYYL